MSGAKIIRGLKEAVEHARAYPAWICEPCGRRLGKRIPTCATWHVGDSCGWCGTETITTEPRDFGYPAPPATPPAPKPSEPNRRKDNG